MERYEWPTGDARRLAVFIAANVGFYQTICSGESRTELVLPGELAHEFLRLAEENAQLRAEVERLEEARRIDEEASWSHHD